MASTTIFAVVLASIATIASGQENAQTRIPNSLMECYEVHELMHREYRLPQTLNTLLDIIRKAENDPAGRNMDMRMMTLSLLHRFRLDGIVQAKKISASNNVVPFSPQSFMFYKHRVLLTNFLPGNAISFPNASLTALERCSFHHMISSTIEEEARGDEGTVCNRLSRYRTERLPRAAAGGGPDDVEQMNAKVLRRMNRRGSMMMPNDDGDNDDGAAAADVDTGIVPGVYNNGGDSSATEPVRSQCPVETGVVQTMWGAVSAGALLAGIAAGLQPLTVTVRQVLPRNEAEEAINNIRVDNKFAATLSGDLAETALLQGPNSRANDPLKVGAAGGWNSTMMPKWYFLSQSTDFEYTDAEIRGGLDGLILASFMKEFTGKASSMKLSQLIDMYYSQRGVFSEKYRACNRRLLVTEVAPTETLTTQTIGFSYILDNSMQLPGTIKIQGFTEYSTNAANSLLSYIPKSLNDLSCSATATSSLNLNVEASTDLVVAVDASWPHHSISQSLSLLIDNINLQLRGSNISLMNAKDGDIVVNYTSSISTFHENYNFSVHQQMPNGLDLPKLLTKIREITAEKMNKEKQTSWSGGQSSIALIVVNSPSISDSDLNFALDQLRILNEQMPDLRFLYIVSGGRERFTNLVKEPAKDIFTISSSSTDSAAPEIYKVIARIKEINRRLINPRCSAGWENQGTGRNSLVEYVAPSMINYYKLAPNYFYKEKASQMVSVQGSGFGSLNVCYSRSIELPKRSNNSVENEGIVCESVTSNTLDINLENACKDTKYIHRCQPLFLSVEGVSLAGSPRCTEIGCRYPDNIKYTINLQELECYSAGNIVMNNLFVLLVPLLVIIKTLFV